MLADDALRAAEVVGDLPVDRLPRDLVVAGLDGRLQDLLLAVGKLVVNALPAGALGGLVDCLR
jgi:hypothetical protein